MHSTNKNCLDCEPSLWEELILGAERERDSPLMFHVFEKKTKNTSKTSLSIEHKNRLPEMKKKERMISKLKHNVLSRKQDMQRKDAECNKNKEARRNASEKDVPQGMKEKR